MTSDEEQKFFAQNITAAYLYYGGTLYYLFLSRERDKKITICSYSKDNSCFSYIPVENSEIHDIFKLLIKCKYGMEIDEYLSLLWSARKSKRIQKRLKKQLRIFYPTNFIKTTAEILKLREIENDSVDIHVYDENQALEELMSQYISHRAYEMAIIAYLYRKGYILKIPAFIKSAIDMEVRMNLESKAAECEGHIQVIDGKNTVKKHYDVHEYEAVIQYSIEDKQYRTTLVLNRTSEINVSDEIALYCLKSNPEILQDTTEFDYPELLFEDDKDSILYKLFCTKNSKSNIPLIVSIILLSLKIGIFVFIVISLIILLIQT